MISVKDFHQKVKALEIFSECDCAGLRTSERH